MNTPNNPLTVDAAFEWLKGLPASQIRDSNNLDGKAGLLLTASVVVLGITAPNGLTTIPATAGPAYVLAILAFVAFGIGGAAGVFALWPRPFDRRDNPTKIKDGWLDADPVEFKAGMLKEIAEATTKNDRHMRAKAIGVQLLTVALVAQTAFIVFALWLRP